MTLDRDPHGGYAEAIRRLRTNLMFVDVTTGRHSFIVTSAMPGEGKTTTTVNLAMAMATTGGRVLLIDGDLRNPSVARTLGIEGGAGLTTVLLGQAGIDDVIQRWRDTSLHVLTAGAIPPNPSELLGSEPMRELFDKLAHEFDFILIDSPPVVPVVDAVLLDRLTGGTLMVVASHRTKKRDLASAVKQLDTVGAKLAGFALNFVPVSESDARRYGYYRFQETPPARPPRRASRRSPRAAKPRADAKGRRVAEEVPSPKSARLARPAPVTPSRLTNAAVSAARLGVSGNSCLQLGHGGAHRPGASPAAATPRPRESPGPAARRAQVEQHQDVRVLAHADVVGTAVARLRTGVDELEDAAGHDEHLAPPRSGADSSAIDARCGRRRPSSSSRRACRSAGSAPHRRGPGRRRR